MELAEALEILIAREGHARWRDLCDPSHPAYDPGYPALVIRLATEDPVPARPQPVPSPMAIPLAGDLVEALAKRIGADRLAKWVATKLGVPCGCPERQAALNRLDASLRRYLAR